MLPHGVIRYHGAPAGLRDIPIGTVPHARGSDPALQPVLPVKNRGTGKYCHSGKGCPSRKSTSSTETNP